jgi:CAAX prenyl protease-like protein
VTKAAIPQALRPVLARCLPFAIYIAFLVFASWLDAFEPGSEGAIDLRWLYAVQISAVFATLLYFRRDYLELARAPRLELAHWGLAFLLGVGIFVVWINLDSGWSTIGELKPGFVPVNAAGRFDWPLIVVRIFGAAAVVPVMEELFWRSFVQRWIDNKDFLALAPAAGSLRALLLTSVVFGFEHGQWLAGIFAGLAYGWLYRRSGSLWPPIVAHSLTNFLLGAWVLYSGQWHFW